ncbi:putative aconitate hydratase [Cyclospora cayetanensis]|uniref:aconitate hydratase n=1 Tax=Cyclospora cayetanensis TaxID=88456 RepID=A0A1D3D2I7_9EIME|nr:putative aconitate hydratase [Cyclospora cayetanensis]
MSDSLSSGTSGNIAGSSAAQRASLHPFAHLLEQLNGFDEKIYAIQKLGKDKVCRLPHCIRVLLESAVRNCDGFLVTEADVERILSWDPSINPKTSKNAPVLDVAFIPARVILQDFTGVPCVVDLAAMRDAMVELGCDPLKINPKVPVDLIIDHSVQVDKARSKDAASYNEAMEMHRNKERFAFLKWAANTFSRMLIVPPGSGIVHQVNLEYLAKVVLTRDGVCFPDSLVGTDSHTTMIDGLGILGWGVGGIEAEATMLGQPVSMTLPPVLGVRLVGRLSPSCTTTDVVLHVVRILRMRGVVDHFVEFFGEACATLSAPDRATIANMSPEFGATIGYFPPDEVTLKYLLSTGRSPREVEKIRAYLLQQGMLRMYDCSEPEVYYTDVLEIDLSKIEPCVAGPKRPQDEVFLRNLKAEFTANLTAPPGFKGFGLKSEAVSLRVPLKFQGKNFELKQGSVVIAAITSCTNTSNPFVMIGAGLLAQKAVELGLSVPPYIKTSLSPGSHVVLRYLEAAGVLPALEALGFYLAGFGCMTCIGNSGDLPEEVTAAIQANPDLITAAVLSGNRNFEGRVHQLTRANYLASPPLCVAFAIAGRVDIDFEAEPLGIGKNGQQVYLRDIWPSPTAVNALVETVLLPSLFEEAYRNIQQGNETWRALEAPVGTLLKWPENSTYIHKPPYFNGLTREPLPVQSISKARCLLLLGTFANIRLVNKLASAPGPITKHFPSGQELPVFDVAQMYREASTPLIVIAGKEYGSGSSRDWAAKGVALLGVKAVIAESYERIHRSNLVGMGVLPLQFQEGESATSLGLTDSKGDEVYGQQSSDFEQVVWCINSLMVTSNRLGEKSLLAMQVDSGAMPCEAAQPSLQSGFNAVAPQPNERHDLEQVNDGLIHAEKFGPDRLAGSIRQMTLVEAKNQQGTVELLGSVSIEHRWQSRREVL